MGIFGRNKKDLIRWQNLVFDKPTPFLHTTEAQLKGITPAIFQRHLEIANDSAKLFNNTANAEVFFSRYDLFIKECEFLIALSEFVKLYDSNISNQLQKAKGQYNQIVMDFINRAWIDTCAKAERLKTEKGKQNKYNKFFELMKQYEHRMPEQCRNHYKTLSTDKILISTDMSNRAKTTEDDDNYEEWLDFISKGGTTKEWNKRK